MFYLFFNRKNKKILKKKRASLSNANPALLTLWVMIKLFHNVIMKGMLKFR